MDGPLDHIATFAAETTALDELAREIDRLQQRRAERLSTFEAVTVELEQALARGSVRLDLLGQLDRLEADLRSLETDLAIAIDRALGSLQIATAPI